MSHPGSIKDQVFKGFEQLGLVEGDPAHSRGGRNYMAFIISFKFRHVYYSAILSFSTYLFKTEKLSYIFVIASREVILDSINCGIMTNFLVPHGICAFLNCS